MVGEYEGQPYFSKYNVTNFVAQPGQFFRLAR